MQDESLCETEKEREEMVTINKFKLIEELKYSSVYNAPVPEWVYKKIAAL